MAHIPSKKKLYKPQTDFSDVVFSWKFIQQKVTNMETFWKIACGTSISHLDYIEQKILLDKFWAQPTHPHTGTQSFYFASMARD